MNIGRDPLLGSFVLLFLTALLLFCTLLSPSPLETPGLDVPCSRESAGTTAVELTGESGRNGIYYIPQGTSLAGFLSMAGIKPIGSIEVPKDVGVFTSATSVHLPSSPSGISVVPMPAEKRLALGIPIDINRSSLEQLMLVPGIGEKTAEKILERRSEKGSFRHLDELMQVKGIKEKRLEKLRRYFCIGC